MRNIDKLVVCPADINTVPIARYNDMLRGYSLQYMVSPKGWGYVNNNISVIDGGWGGDVQITDDFELAIARCDAVLFSDSYNRIDFDKYLFPKIHKAVACNKKVMLSFQNHKEYEDKIRANLEAGADITFLNKKIEFDISREKIKQQLYGIGTPVIFVAGLGERCNKFETQLTLRNYFVQNGYKVCQLGSKSYSSLFGFDSLPDFLFSDFYNAEEKIFLFSYYMRMLEKETEPDVFIIGLPGGIMPFDQKATNHFGIIPYIISSAVTPDCVVFNSYFSSFTESYFHELNNYCKYKFGFEITCFNIANTKYSVNLEDREHYLNFLSLDSHYVMSNIPEEIIEKWKLFNVLMNKDNQAMGEYICNVLSGNIGMMIS